MKNLEYYKAKYPIGTKVILSIENILGVVVGNHILNGSTPVIEVQWENYVECCTYVSHILENYINIFEPKVALLTTD